MKQCYSSPVFNITGNRACVIVVENSLITFFGEQAEALLYLVINISESKK